MVPSSESQEFDGLDSAQSSTMPEFRHPGPSDAMRHHPTEEVLNVRPRLSSPDPDAQLRAMRETSNVWYWEQDSEFRFTLDLRGRDDVSEEGSVVGIRRWESTAVPSEGTWDDHRRWLEARKPFRDFEFRVGEGPGARYISTTGVPVYAADGTFAGYRGTAMDVTELRNAREQSDRAQAFLKLANRLGRVAAWQVEVAGMQATWSTEFLQLLGFGPSQVPTIADVFGLVHRRLQPDVDRVWRACLRNGDPFDVEVRIFASPGRARWVRLLGEARRDANGKITHIQGAAQDISESKEDRERLRSLGEQLVVANAELATRVRERTRELELVNTELKGFAHALAHDLKQPIVAVQWFSTALDDAIARRDPAKSAHLNDQIKAAGRRMLDYVDALLSLAETSQAALHVTDVDLSDMAEAVLDDLERRDPARRLVRAIQPGLVARGDRRLLRMLLENLLGNAWKFTAGRAEARISLTSRPDDDGRTIYDVRDNGAGFDMAFAGKLFGSFQRLHSSSEFAGTGVGLANVQRIVTRHDGRIWAEAHVGAGATFSFTLGEPTL